MFLPKPAFKNQALLARETRSKSVYSHTHTYTLVRQTSGFAIRCIYTRQNYHYPNVGTQFISLPQLPLHRAPVKGNTNKCLINATPCFICCIFCIETVLSWKKNDELARLKQSHEQVQVPRVAHDFKSCSNWQFQVEFAISCPLQCVEHKNFLPLNNLKPTRKQSVTKEKPNLLILIEQLILYLNYIVSI